MQMTPGKTQARKDPLTKSVSNNVNIKNSFMISFYVFITNKIFHKGQQTNENQARELYTKCTFTRKKQQEQRTGKTWEICFSGEKREKGSFFMQTT